MDLQYAPPSQDPVECAYLRRNMLNCLREKAVKDQVDNMVCTNEKLLWFNLECPEEWKKFNDPVQLRQTFIAEKKLIQEEKPKWIKL